MQTRRGASEEDESIVARDDAAHRSPSSGVLRKSAGVASIGAVRHRLGAERGTMRTTRGFESIDVLPSANGVDVLASTASHSKSVLERHLRPRPCGQRRKTAAAVSTLLPRHAVRQSRSFPEVLTMAGGSGPSLPMTKPVLASVRSASGRLRSRMRKLLTRSSSSPHAVRLCRKNAQQGFGSRSLVPEHAGQKPHVVRCSGSEVRKSCMLVRVGVGVEVRGQ